MPASGGDDHGLARLDGFGDSAELRARAEEVIAGLDIDPRPGAGQQGADASNSVWVTVDASGAVLDVSISRQWAERLAVEWLGEAVLEAYSRAQDKRGAAATLAVMRRGDGPADDGPVEPYDPGMPDIDDPHWFSWVWHSISEADLRVDQLRARRSADAPAERTVAGPNGYVRVRATGPRITAVLIDAPGVAERDPDAVAVDARVAFDMARTGGPSTSTGTEHAGKVGDEFTR